MRRLLKFFFCFFSTGKVRVSWVFSNWYLGGSSGSLKQLDCIDNKLVHKFSGNRIGLDQVQVFHPRLDWLSWLLKSFEFERGVDAPILVFKNNNGIMRLPVRSINDVLVLMEVFRDNVYKWVPSKETVMLDFGMNNGIVSLEAAFSGYFKHVYAYELVPGTYQNAIESIALNPNLKNRISVFNIGVGRERRRVDTSMFEPGSIVANIYNSSISPHQTSEVEVVPAGDVVRYCHEAHPASQLFIKMDIEGAELEVIESLEKSDVLGLISCLIIEWHQNLLSPICEILKRNGFSYRFSMFEANNQMGMIYASK